MSEEKLLEKLGKEELERRIKEKQKEYAGLLNREGALYAIAKEEGLLDPAEEYTVEKVYGKKQFGEGRYYSSLILSGEKGRVRLVFWDKDADLAGKYSPGDRIKVSGAREKEGRMGPELHYTKSTRIEKLEPGREENEIELSVVRVFPRRFFEKGVVRTAVVEENGREKRLVLWNGHAFHPLSAGQTVTVKGYREKEGEVHTVRSTMISESRRPSDRFPRKRMAELAPGEPAGVRAVVTRVFEPRIVDYCPRHNTTGCQCQDKRKSLVLSLVLSDSSGEKRSVAFFDTAEDLAGITGQDLARDQNPYETVKNKLLGEEKVFHGSLSGDGTEFVIRGFREYSIKQELEGS